MIKPSILARKIIAQCPELNISEAQLTKDIETALKVYSPKPISVGCVNHWNQIDADIVLEYPECKFCGSVHTYYQGYKCQTGYHAFQVCIDCGHWGKL